MMEKTIKINLGGILFQIDEEAYKILRQYLQAIDTRLKYTQGGTETIEDIESRIAEIFQSQKSLAGVITKENVEAMISIIGRPEDFDISGEMNEEQAAYSQTSSEKKLYRNPDDKIISGVCGGIGPYLNIESVWIRILFILFACFFFIGVLVYIALWIALPSAVTDAQKKEMYGGRKKSSHKGNHIGDTLAFSNQGYSPATAGTSNIGNAFNEVFRAFGKVIYIIFRVFLIIIGVTFVAAGFVTLVSFIMVFFFKYPGYFSTSSYDVNLFYLPDFLNYVVNPAVAPWILALAFIVILMPLLAIIYWGVKMIFWFSAKDGIFALAGLILWVVSVAALSLLLFNEGISYAETARSVSTEVIEKTPHDLYIFSGKRVSDLNFDKDISFPEEDYNIYFIDDNKGLFISSSLDINNSDDHSARLNIRKRSTGRSRTDATRKAEELTYGYKISGDTIFLDEYFTIPAGNKWSFDNVGINLYIPLGTIVHFDKTTYNMFNQSDYHGWDSHSDADTHHSAAQPWEMTDEGLRQRPEEP